MLGVQTRGLLQVPDSEIELEARCRRTPHGADDTTDLIGRGKLLDDLFAEGIELRSITTCTSGNKRTQHCTLSKIRILVSLGKSEQHLHTAHLLTRGCEAELVQPVLFSGCNDWSNLGLDVLAKGATGCDEAPAHIYESADVIDSPI